MEERFSRTELLLGAQKMERLYRARIAIFGIGGVGGFAAEGLIRCGISSFTLVDSDTVSVSNINRQIIAAEKTIGRYKTDVMKERMLDINPKAVVDAKKMFFLPETAKEFDFSGYSYVIDAVDTVAAKLAIIKAAQDCGVPVISCMGAGNKLDPTKFQVADIYATSVCPLARVMRRECRKLGIEKLKVVYSTEQPFRAGKSDEIKARNESAPRRDIPGSVSFVPSVAGLIIAGEVIKDIAGVTQKKL